MSDPTQTDEIPLERIVAIGRDDFSLLASIFEKGKVSTIPEILEEFVKSKDVRVLLHSHALYSGDGIYYARDGIHTRLFVAGNDKSYPFQMTNGQGERFLHPARAQHEMSTSRKLVVHDAQLYDDLVIAVESVDQSVKSVNLDEITGFKKDKNRKDFVELTLSYDGDITKAREFYVREYGAKTVEFFEMVYGKSLFTKETLDALKNEGVTKLKIKTLDIDYAFGFLEANDPKTLIAMPARLYMKDHIVSKDQKERILTADLATYNIAKGEYMMGRGVRSSIRMSPIKISDGSPQT